MGINTNIYFMFGWEVDVTDAYRELMEETDYDNIKGVIATDMDFNKAYVGTVLDESGDLRWNPSCFGNTFWESEKAADKLMEELGQGALRDLLNLFSELEAHDPKFGVVQVHS